MKNRSARTQTSTPSKFTPSEFGSHKSMINEELTEKLIDPLDPNLIGWLSNDLNTLGQVVVLTDEYGDYITLNSHLDTRLADPNRYWGFENTGVSTSITKSNFTLRQDRTNSVINNKN